jgi:hypothetical protein
MSEMVIEEAAGADWRAFWPVEVASATADETAEEASEAKEEMGFTGVMEADWARVVVARVVRARRTVETRILWCYSRGCGVCVFV